MNRKTLSRVVKLERVRSEARGWPLLVVQDQDQAERLAGNRPNALVIVTGVPR